MENLKKCSKCLIEKDLECFNWADRPKNRKKPYCRDCDKTRQKKVYKDLKDYRINDTLNWRRENYPRYLEYQKYYNKNRRVLPHEKN